MNRKNIFYEVFHDLKTKNTKIAKKVYEWLNNDYVDSIIINNNVWYYEIHSLYNMPIYVFNYLNKYMEKNYDVKYLYETVSGVQ